MATDAQFLAASKHFESIYKSCSDNEKLKMYALYNQATTGDIKESAPSVTAVVKYAKYNARKKLIGMTPEQAAKRYVSELRRMDPTWGSGDSEVSADAAAAAAFDAEVAPAKASTGGIFSSVSRKSISKSPAKPAVIAAPAVDQKTFERACDYASKSGLFRDDVHRTVLYAYYKQATVGPCTTAAPMFSVRKRYARWRAWCNLFDMPKEEAKAQYVARVRKVAGAAFDSGAPPVLDIPEIVETPITKVEAIPAVINSSFPKIGDSADDIVKGCQAVKSIGGFVYLLTGATGFVGKHLMERLLRRNPNSLILCITRGTSLNKLVQFSKERYGIEQAPRIVGVKGDLTTALLGLDATRLKALTGVVDHMFHIAAVYDMKASDEENEKTNVGGTREAVKVANQIGVKLFHHVSSIAVAGDYDGLFFENMFDEGQRFDHAYLRTKFESEKIVRSELKVQFRVYRPGIIIGSSKNGEADKVDGVVYLFKPIQQTRKFLPQGIVLPCIEGETQPIVPIDYVADAMDAIAHRNGIESGRAFHLVDPSPPTLVELMNIFAEAAHAPTYSSRLPTLLNSLIPKKVWSAIESIPIIESAPYGIISSVFGVPNSVVGYAQWRVDFDTGDTQDMLQGTNIRCPPLKSYAWRVWDYYERFMDLRNVDRPRALRDEVSGKLVVVTGSSDGIGARLAERLGKQGAKVILVARTMDKLKVVGDKIRSNGGIAYEHLCDISKGDDCVRCVNEISKAYGPIDFLINNAGRSIRRSVEYQCTPDRFHDFQRTMELNYYGTVRFITGFLPGMRKKKAGQILNVSSVGVVTNAPRFSAYVASKAAMDAFSRCISAEIHADNVSISTIYMPLVATKMVQSKGNKFDHMNLLSTDDACELIERAMVTKERTIMTTTAKIIFVAYYFFPSLVEALLSRQYRLEPEVAPEGKENSASAAGDKQQLIAISTLLRGGTMQGAQSSKDEKN